MRLTIPYYLHKAGAGFPSPATDYIEEDIDLNVHLIKNVPVNDGENHPLDQKK